jgi:hypothetical protein
MPRLAVPTGLCTMNHFLPVKSRDGIPPFGEMILNHYDRT